MNSIVHSCAIGHPNKRTVRKMTCYQNTHENTSFLSVDIVAHTSKSGTFYFLFLKVYSLKNQNWVSRFSPRNLTLSSFKISVLEICIPTGVLELVNR